MGTQQKASGKSVKLSQGVPVAAKYSIGTFFARASQQQLAKPTNAAAATAAAAAAAAKKQPLESDSQHNIAQGVATQPVKPNTSPKPLPPKPAAPAPQPNPAPQPAPPPAMGNIFARPLAAAVASRKRPFVDDSEADEPIIQMSQDDPADRTEVLWCPPVTTAARGDADQPSSSSRPSTSGGGGGGMMNRALQKLLGRQSHKRRAAAVDPAHDMLDQFMSSSSSETSSNPAATSSPAVPHSAPAAMMPPPPPLLRVWPSAVGSQGSQERDVRGSSADRGKALHTPSAPGVGPSAHLPPAASTSTPSPSSSSSQPSRKALMDLLEKVESKVHEKTQREHPRATTTPSSSSSAAAAAAAAAPSATQTTAARSSSAGAPTSGLAAMLLSKRPSPAAPVQAPQSRGTSASASVPVSAIDPPPGTSKAPDVHAARPGSTTSPSTDVVLSVSTEPHCAGTQHTQEAAQGTVVTATDAGQASTALRQQSRYEVLEVRVGNRRPWVCSGACSHSRERLPVLG